MFCSERLQSEVQNHVTIFIYGSAKKPDEKKELEEEKTDSNSAHCSSQAKWQLVQTSYIKQFNILLFAIW